MNAAAYVGAHYELRGCWELLRRVYRAELQIDLPSYASAAPTMDRERLSELIRAERAAWISIAPGDERPTDAILFRVLGRESHIGIVVEKGRFLHARPGTQACIESYRAPQWSRRVEGFYRHGAAP